MVMPIRYIDGFDWCDQTHELIWYTSGAWGAPVAGRHGVGQAIDGDFSKALLGGPYEYASAGIAFKPTGFGTSVLRFRANSVTVVNLVFDSSGFLRVEGAGGATLSTYSGFQANLNVWYHFGLAARCHDTLGAVRVWVNGNLIPELSSNNVDTNSGVNTFSEFQVSALAKVDDLWLCYDNSISGSLDDEFHGDLIVRELFPTSDGEHNQWTALNGGSKYVEVDEIGPDDDTTYIHDGTAGNRQCFGFGTLPSDIASIKAVQLCSVNRYVTTGPHSIRNYVREVGTANHDSAAQALTTQHVGYPDLLANDPVTGAPWTKSGFEARQYGIKDES